MARYSTMKILFCMSVMGFISATASAYQCQLSVIPDEPRKTFSWDGSVPQSWSFKYKGQTGYVNVDSIGLPDHPEWLFSFKWAGRNLFASSQKKDLRDYNLTWQSDVGPSNQGLISLACRAAAE